MTSDIIIIISLSPPSSSKINKVKHDIITFLEFNNTLNKFSKLITNTI